jgi:hypothetical protein
VDAAYKAMGLTNSVNTLVVKGSMHTWDPGESAPWSLEVGYGRHIWSKSHESH